MGTLSAQRSRAARHPPTAHDTAALVQFAIDQVLRCEADFDGLPSVLERLAGSWDAEAALALALHPGGAPAVLAGYPDEVTSRTMLPAAIVALVQAHPAAVAAVRSGGSMQAPLAAGEWSDRPVSALVAWAAAGAGEQRCAVVLIGDPASWDAQTRATTRMLAAVVAAQFRHAGDLAFLQEREAVTKALIDASPDAVLVMDAERRVAAFNPAAEKLYGWQREDVLGKDMASMLIPEHDRARFLAGTESFLARRDPGEFTGRMNLPVLRSDGSEQMVEMTPLPLVVRGQVYFCGFLRDLAESERAQAALEAQAEDFRLLARRAPVGIAETSPDGRCSFVNERWCVLNGGTAADFVNSGLAWRAFGVLWLANAMCYLFTTAFTLLIDPTTGRRVWAEAFLFAGVVNVTVMVAAVVTAPMYALAVKVLAAAGFTLTQGWVVGAVVFIYVWQAASMGVARLALLAEGRPGGWLLSRLLLFTSGYGPLMAAVTLASYVSELKGTEARWEKTEKSGKVTASARPPRGSRPAVGPAAARQSKL
jgi:PAS domain S-box-containing protein